VTLAQRIVDVAHLTGTFQLRSGTTAMTYFDKYRFESDPELLREIVKEMAPKIPTDTEVLAGLELGGIPIVTALSAETGLPACFVRKVAKTYGTERICEGVDIDGKCLTVVEDVVTTGGQIVLSADDLRREGATVSNALCVIDRESGAVDVLLSNGITLHPLFTMSELMAP
jgi:orotate phosphoribosyltransferase